MPEVLEVDDMVAWKYQIDAVYTQKYSQFYCYKITNLVSLRELILKIPRINKFTELHMKIMEAWSDIGNYPNIVQLLYVEHKSTKPKFIMESVASLTLEEMISNGSFYQEPDAMSLSMKIYKILLTVSSALNYAHQRKIFHFNLKPSNILQIHNKYIQIIV